MSEQVRFVTQDSRSTVSDVELEVLLPTLMHFSPTDTGNAKAVKTAYLTLMKQNVFYAALYEVVSRVLKDCGADGARSLAAQVVANITAPDDEKRIAEWVFLMLTGAEPAMTEEVLAAARERLLPMVLLNAPTGIVQ